LCSVSLKGAHSSFDNAGARWVRYPPGLRPLDDRGHAHFCAFRSDEAARRGEDTSKLGREEWLEGRRAELQARMRQRRTSYAPSGNWTPSFKFT
jgi:hypothetical protein